MSLLQFFGLTSSERTVGMCSSHGGWKDLGVEFLKHFLSSYWEKALQKSKGFPWQTECYWINQAASDTIHPKWHTDTPTHAHSMPTTQIILCSLNLKPADGGLCSLPYFSFSSFGSSSLYSKCCTLQNQTKDDKGTGCRLLVVFHLKGILFSSSCQAHVLLKWVRTWMSR